MARKDEKIYMKSPCIGFPSFPKLGWFFMCRPASFDLNLIRNIEKRERS